MKWIETVLMYDFQDGTPCLSDQGWTVGLVDKSNILSRIDKENKKLLIGPHFALVLLSSQHKIVLHQIAHIKLMGLDQSNEHNTLWEGVCKLLGLPDPSSVFEDEEFIRMCNGEECSIFNINNKK